MSAGILVALSWLLVAFSGLLCIPVAALVTEVLAALWSWPPSSSITGYRPQIAALVPAHNEREGLLPTLQSLKAQLRPGDRLVVVADNCSDDTADVARSSGAEVTERNEPEKIGKGYALEWGIRYLNVGAPWVVVVVDADCQLDELALCRLATTAAAENRPIQARYMMVASDALAGSEVARFAWLVRNYVRPLGLKRLGLPCQLMGTGMAFPADIAASMTLAAGHIVEDLNLGVELAVIGRAPVFCPSAIVTSRFPVSADSGRRQRQRWEQGHISTILTQTPRLVRTAIKTGNWLLLALALDLAVPPLTLLGMLVMACLCLAGATALLGVSGTPLAVAGINAAAFMAAVVVAWYRFGRHILPIRSALGALPYALRKFPIYVQFVIRGPVSRWERTDRD